MGSAVESPEMEEYVMAKTARTAGGRAKRVNGSRKPNGETKTGTDLRSDLREFAKGRPQGWNHEEWLGFLEDLRGRGHNIHDHEALGSMLERERINVMLEKVPGLGPQRIESLAQRYGNIWRLREADAEQIAVEARLPREVAHRVVEVLHH